MKQQSVNRHIQPKPFAGEAAGFLSSRNSWYYDLRFSLLRGKRKMYENSNYSTLVTHLQALWIG